MNLKLLVGSTLISSMIGLCSVVPGAIAATFYDFSIKWSDNTMTTGWFQIDEQNPYHREVSTEPGFEATTTLFSSATDFTINHRGQVFTKNSLPRGYTTTFFAQIVNYPTTSYYYGLMGSQLRSFEFQIQDQNSPSYLKMFHYDSQSGYYEQNNPEATYAASFDGNYRYTNTVNWMERGVAQASPVPEPNAFVGLTIVGMSLVALRRRTYH